MDCQEPKLLSADYLRRFGVEIEINAFDGRDRPEGWPKVLPEGTYYVGELLRKTTQESVVLHKWDYDHNNRTWIVKPDGSCGLEICSPVSKGWHDLKKVCRVVESFRNDQHVAADHRCSLHVHVEIGDMSPAELASIITWWVKCEPVFFDSVPPSRKRNRYCQFLGLTDLFEHDSTLSPETLIKNLGEHKYSSMNTYHLKNHRRNTIEFRIMENSACLDPFFTKNWVRLLLHFVQMTYMRKLPPNYVKGDPWTGWLWLNPNEVMHVLGFAPGQFNLSPGLQQTRTWFLGRLLQHTMNTGLPGASSDIMRRQAYEQVQQLISDLNLGSAICTPITEEMLYGEEFRV